jgi:hypothetical protein
MVPVNLLSAFSKYEAADWVQFIVARYYEPKLGASVVSVGEAPGWDIKYAEGTTMEVKLDASASSTFNAAIEYWDLRRNKPTGILSTRARVWLHCIPEGDGLHCYEIDTGRLRRAIIEDGRVVQGGDYNSSVMKLLPLQKLKEIADREFRLDSELIKIFRPW